MLIGRQLMTSSVFSNGPDKKEATTVFNVLECKKVLNLLLSVLYF